jgi:hypothetical protein
MKPALGALAALVLGLALAAAPADAKPKPSVTVSLTYAPCESVAFWGGDLAHCASVVIMASHLPHSTPIPLALDAYDPIAGDVYDLQYSGLYTSTKSGKLNVTIPNWIGCGTGVQTLQVILFPVFGIGTIPSGVYSNFVGVCYDDNGFPLFP